MNRTNGGVEEAAGKFQNEQVLYGKLVPYDKLLNGDASVPEAARVLTKTVEKYAPTTRGTSAR